MNPLIKELANKALKQPDTDNDGLTVFDNDELKKLAELIVRECICQCDDENSQKYIMAHFGMKESDWN